MFIRYRRSENGSPVAKALVYTQAEHGIDLGAVDPESVRIVKRLKENGHQAYIVGGAVRDLLLGRRPKDFDLVTDAHPARIKKLFRNARIIGKRFRLVHLYVGTCIYELSTFRSIANGSIGNEFGSMDEDALRRDFSFNALYFDPTDQTLVDYVGGVKDIRARRVKPVIPIKTIFKEDPVRMIRGIKYAVKANFSIPLTMKMAIKRDAPLLAATSASRRTEEFFKILASGSSALIVKELCKYRLFACLAPEAWKAMQADSAFAQALYDDLRTLDALVVRAPASPSADPSQGQERQASLLLTWYLKSFVQGLPEGLAPTHESYSQALKAARDFLLPLNPPRLALEAAVREIFILAGLPLRRGRAALIASSAAKPRSRRGGKKKQAPATAAAPTAPKVPPAAAAAATAPAAAARGAQGGERAALSLHDT